MTSHKLVILRGRPASGKSTAFANLKKQKEMKNWVFIDHPALKGVYARSSVYRYKEVAKFSLFAILEIFMKEKRNIVIEEMSRETLNKYIGKKIKNYKYKFIVFQFTVKTRTGISRDIKRVKNPKHSHTKRVNIPELHKMHDERFDKNAVLVDTNKLNKSQVVELILKKIK